jgi:hypothetical protein
MHYFFIYEGIYPIKISMPLYAYTVVFIHFCHYNDCMNTNGNDVKH